MTEESQAPQLRSWAIIPWLLVGAIVVLDTLVGLLVGWRPVGLVESLFLALLTGYCVLVLVIALIPALHRQLQRHAIDALTFLGVIVLALLSFEGGLLAKAAKKEQAHFHTRGGNLHYALQPDPTYIAGIEGISQYRTNQDGHREYQAYRQSQNKLLVLGGSTAESIYLDDTETWPARFMRIGNARFYRPRFWVGNAGISGYGLAEQLHYLQASPIPENIGAILIQPGIEDLQRFLQGEKGTPAPPARLPYASRWQQMPILSRFPLWHQSRILQEITLMSRQNRKTIALTPGIHCGEEYDLLRQQRAASSRVDTLPDLTAALDQYGTLLQRCIDATQDQPITLLFATQPVLWQTGLSPEAQAQCWMGRLDDGRYLSLPVLRQVMDAYNTVLLEVCRENDVRCIDLSPLSGDVSNFYDDCHFTEKGAIEAARIVNATLRGWISESFAPPGRRRTRRPVNHL